MNVIVLVQCKHKIPHIEHLNSLENVQDIQRTMVYTKSEAGFDKAEHKLTE